MSRGGVWKASPKEGEEIKAFRPRSGYSAADEAEWNTKLSTGSDQGAQGAANASAKRTEDDEGDDDAASSEDLRCY